MVSKANGPSCALPLNILQCSFTIHGTKGLTKPFERQNCDMKNQQSQVRFKGNILLVKKHYSRDKPPGKRVLLIVYILYYKRKVMTVCHLLCRMEVSLIMVSDRHKVVSDCFWTEPKLYGQFLPFS